MFRYENSVEDLSRECSSLQAQLQAQAEDLHQQTATVEELRNDLVQIEGLLDEERQQGETTKDKLETEVDISMSMISGGCYRFG